MPPAGSLGSDGHRNRRRWGFAILTAVVVGGVVLLVAPATIAVSQKYAIDFGSSVIGSSQVHFNDNWPQWLCPSGAKVSVTFTSTGLGITFSIVAPNGTAIWSQHSAAVSVGFVVPSCGTFHFNAMGSGSGSYNVNGTVAYSAPHLS